jgi:hypothetical protein
VINKMSLFLAVTTLSAATITQTFVSTHPQAQETLLVVSFDASEVGQTVGASVEGMVVASRPIEPGILSNVTPIGVAQFRFPFAPAPTVPFSVAITGPIPANIVASVRGYIGPDALLSTGATPLGSAAEMAVSNPEPGSAMMLVGGLAFLFLGRRAILARCC